jgi:hypothetical protein
MFCSLGADVAHIPGYEVTTIFRFDFTDPNVLFTADSSTSRMATSSTSPTA